MGTRLKTVFTFTLPVARMIRQLAEFEARKSGVPVDTQAYLNQLIFASHQDMEAEQRAARRVRTCPMCQKTFSGGPSCPQCGQWVA